MLSPVNNHSASGIGSQRWIPFIENKEFSSYSFYLPHQQINEHDKILKKVEQDDTNVYVNDYSQSKESNVFTTEQLNKWFHELHPSRYEGEPAGDAWTDASYKGQLLLRKTAWHSFDERCTCEYGYSDTWQPLIKSRRMMKVLEEITDAVSEVVSGGTGASLAVDGEDKMNCVNLNWYPKGGGVGFHADDEFLFDGLNREVRIISLSLCSEPQLQLNTDVATTSDAHGDNCNTSTATTITRNWGARKFQVKRKGKKHASDVKEIILRHGDLMTMEGMFQKYYLHSVWPGDCKSFGDHELCQGERINLTWRTIVRHLDGSPECRGMVCPLSNETD